MNGQAILVALREESALCGELAGLRLEQRRLIEAGEAELLLEVLARKQRAIGRITQLEEELRPVKTDWERQRGLLPAAQRIAVGEAFREVRQRLEELIRHETEDAEALAARKDQVAKELETFDRKRRLETLYRQPDGAGESRYVDRRDA
jgi:hypothetical protein